MDMLPGVVAEARSMEMGGLEPRIVDVISVEIGCVWCCVCVGVRVGAKTRGLAKIAEGSRSSATIIREKQT
jgi:hypothetical protein